MIIRIWHGTTLSNDAASYKQLLFDKVFPEILNKKVTGYRGIQLLENKKIDLVEFITIMGFDNWKAVKNFAGEDYEQSYVISEAKRFLVDFDRRAQHYELVYNDLQYG